MGFLCSERISPHRISPHLFPLRYRSTRSTIMGWKHPQPPFAPVLTTVLTGPTPSFGKWTLVMGTSGSLLVGWTLLLFGYNQISMSLTTGMMLIPSPLVGATRVSHAVCSNRTPRNRETQKGHAKTVKLADRVAKRKLTAQPEIRYAIAKQVLKNREPRTDEHFVDAIHASHKRPLSRNTQQCFSAASAVR